MILSYALLSRLHGSASVFVPGSLTLNPLFDLGVSSSDNISNFTKPSLFISVDSGIDAGSVISLTDNGVEFANSSIAVSDYNAGSISTSSTALSDGTHPLGGSITDNSSVIPITGFNYRLDTSISQPSITGTSPSNSQTPTFTVTFGAVKPSSGFVLVLGTVSSGVFSFNTSKVLGAGDLTSTTIQASTLPLGRYNMSCYVYGPSPGFLFSEISATFAQTIDPISFTTTAVTNAPAGQGRWGFFFPTAFDPAGTEWGTVTPAWTEACNYNATANQTTFGITLQ